MASVAILIGNAKYQNLSQLDCCTMDVKAIHELLIATEKYDTFEIILDATADEAREKIRATVKLNEAISEIFFYFTGHGIQLDDDFYYCGTNFDPKRPNATGLSTDELHGLLKLSDPELVVKVVDACNSGTLLVKEGVGFVGQVKSGFKNLVQISSCLDSQSALTGTPLSLFTEQFQKAALRKEEGAIYYTDIIASLRDEFLRNTRQTPHFVFQATGREVFVDDANRLNDLRAKIFSTERQEAPETTLPIPAMKPTLLQMLEDAEGKIVTPERLELFAGSFFDALTIKIKAEDVNPYFDIQIIEHSDFDELTAKAFMVRVLSREKRPDKFVTATIDRQRRRRSPFDFAGNLMGQLALYGSDDEVVETWDLSLNCKMSRAQIKITLTPKFTSLKKIVVVATCAPSLEHCYIFEVTTQHSRTDFNDFDPEGAELSRRWWQVGWGGKTSGIVDQIVAKLTDAVSAHLESVSQRLANKDK